MSGRQAAYPGRAPCKPKQLFCGTARRWSVEPIELDPPKEGEVLIKLAASGMCHSDEHLLTGDMPVPLPVIGGHEGAGVVEEVGPGVTGPGAGRPRRARFRPRLREVPARAPPGTRTCATWAAS